MGFPQLGTRAAAFFAIFLLASLVAVRRRPSLPVGVIDGLIHASTQSGTPFSTGINTSSWSSFYDATNTGLLQLYDPGPVSETSPSVPYLQPLLQCRRARNPKTNHIRLPIPLLNITLKPLDTHIDPEPRHFNPTIIPLPSYAASFTSARYLLVARLVTPGLHQESLACLATFCLPQPNTTSTHLPPDTVPCTSKDALALGVAGGMRCVTKPRRLNIPPTPAKQCTGKWASFPDIPGFHDPRIIWSGTGEPLIVVNSASTYGCVGLWLMDLRALLPELKDVMERRAPTLAAEEKPNDTMKRAEKRSERRGAAHSEYLQPVLRYETLTELTRWEGRSEVEKNWILWFPGQEGETWVSYESFGHWKPESADGRDVHAHAGEPIQKNASQGDREGEYAQQHSLASIPPWPAFNASNATQDLNSSSLAPISTPWKPSLATPAPSFTSSVHASSNSNSSSSSSRPPSSKTDSTSDHRPVNHSHLVTRREPTPLTSPHSWTFQGGRSISKLTSHGQTTPNLTSPHEPPCLPPSFFTDPLGMPGHFHQSTPALTLILCDRSTLSPSSSSSSSTNTNKDTNPTPSCATGTPQTWTQSGRAVHFTLVHRKFSDGALGMPLRYERWAVVWEGRYPFRLLAVSRHPVAFAGELVRPWMRAENGLGDDDDDGERAGDAGFTYTTSVAWAWRPASAVVVAGVEDEERGGQDAEHLARLGVGFLGDEVIVGVGIDDIGQAVVRVKVDELLSCLRLCPGVGGAE